MLATRRTGSVDPRCSLSRLRSSFSRLKLRLVTCSLFRSRSSRRSSLRSKRSPPRSDRSKRSPRSRLELFLKKDRNRSRVRKRYLKSHYNTYTTWSFVNAFCHVSCCSPLRDSSVWIQRWGWRLLKSREPVQSTGGWTASCLWAWWWKYSLSFEVLHCILFNIHKF